MKKTHYILFILWLLSTYLSFGQTFQNNTEAGTNIKESIFMHQNTTLLFSGEYLYYTLYCLDLNEKQLSELSKIAYIELVGEDLNTIFKHKIKLDKGLGQGDYFVPTSVPSGNYKLLAYTQWMQNQSNDSFFQSDITIINPYQGNQKQLLGDTTSITYSIKSNHSDDEPVENNIVSFSIPKNIYSQREQVMASLQLQNGMSIDGNYSISVRKKDTLQKWKASTFTLDVENEKAFKNNGLLLPELRGELLYGKILAKDALASVANKKIAISVPGEQFALKIATTDTQGNFAFVLDDVYDGNKVYVQVLEKANDYKILFNEPPSISHKGLVFNKFKMTPAMKDAILERSVYNQINNGYFSVRPDTLVGQTYTYPFSNKDKQTYHLDDYTRFPTVKETFVELIEKVSVVKNINNTYEFKVIPENASLLSEGFPALLMVDGMMVLDHNDFINFDARKIKTVHIIRRTYFYGAQVFNGIVQIETIDGNYHESINSPSVYSFPLLKPLVEKHYFKQTYGSLNADEVRDPDFRYQLLWLPKLKVKNQHAGFSFFTSDITGDFEISMEGFTNEGKPVSVKKVITVK